MTAEAKSRESGVVGAAKVIRRGPKHPLGPRLPLRALRESQGLTQAEVAKAAEMDQSEISRVERRDELRLSTLRKYVEAFGGELELVVTLKTGHRFRVERVTSGAHFRLSGAEVERLRRMPWLACFPVGLARLPGAAANGGGDLGPPPRLGGKRSMSGGTSRTSRNPDLAERLGVGRRAA